jgi:hypothetical protein
MYNKLGKCNHLVLPMTVYAKRHVVIAFKSEKRVLIVQLLQVMCIEATVEGDTARCTLNR